MVINAIATIQGQPPNCPNWIVFRLFELYILPWEFRSLEFLYMDNSIVNGRLGKTNLFCHSAKSVQIQTQASKGQFNVRWGLDTHQQYCPTRNRVMAAEREREGERERERERENKYKDVWSKVTGYIILNFPLNRSVCLKCVLFFLFSFFIAYIVTPCTVANRIYAPYLCMATHREE